jgi:hypothetical protein
VRLFYQVLAETKDIYRTNIISNTVLSSGGGISNYGQVGVNIVNIDSSTISNNISTGVFGIGGGLTNYSTGVGLAIVDINNSTISNNSAEQGGGLFNADPQFIGSISHIIHSTFTGNIGGAIYNNTGTLNLYTSILANSLIRTDCEFEIDPITDLGYNLIEDGSCGFPAVGDPLLGPLQDNGGSTWTHALLPDSPAIDAIPTAECSADFDQRGVARPQGSGCDIGAFEFQYNLNAGDDQTTNEGQQVQFSGTADNLDITDTHWDFGDGFTATDTLSPTHTYPDNGVFTVILTVTDTLGEVANDWLQVTVENVAPTLSTFPDLEITIGETITITGTITDPGVLDSQTVAITWETGVTETIDLAAAERQFSATHIFVDTGLHPVTVRVTDKDGDWDEKSFTVTVSSSGYWVFIPIVKR